MAESALDRAVRALARRDLSADELSRRLERAGVAEREREEALATLRRAGYVDDGRFAHARAGALAARGLGDDAIRADLEQRGVEPELVEHALAALEPELERAQRLVAVIAHGPRAVRTLARRGFGPESIEAVAHRRHAELGYESTT